MKKESCSGHVGGSRTRVAMAGHRSVPTAARACRLAEPLRRGDSGVAEDVVPKILIASQDGKEGGSPMTVNVMETWLTLMMSERLGGDAARSRRRGMRQRTPFANGSKAT